jgi:hypothetical protein
VSITAEITTDKNINGANGKAPMGNLHTHRPIAKRLAPNQERKFTARTSR